MYFDAVVIDDVAVMCWRGEGGGVAVWKCWWRLDWVGGVVENSGPLF
jgi:hypothetical protein